MSFWSDLVLIACDKAGDFVCSRYSSKSQENTTLSQQFANDTITKTKRCFRMLTSFPPPDSVRSIDLFSILNEHKGNPSSIKAQLHNLARSPAEHQFVDLLIMRIRYSSNYLN